MKCVKCGRELRIGTEQVGVDYNGLPVFHRFGYCDNCKMKWDIDVMAQQNNGNTSKRANKIIMGISKEDIKTIRQIRRTKLHFGKRRGLLS